jgi:hypothetical protein
MNAIKLHSNNKTAIISKDLCSISGLFDSTFTSYVIKLRILVIYLIRVSAKITDSLEDN